MIFIQATQDDSFGPKSFPPFLISLLFFRAFRAFLSDGLTIFLGGAKQGFLLEPHPLFLNLVLYRHDSGNEIKD